MVGARYRMKTKFESHFRLIFAEVNDFTETIVSGLINMVKNKKSNKASKIYTKMFWGPLRRLELGQYAAASSRAIPKPPVVMSKAKKDPNGRVSFTMMGIRYDLTWAQLRDHYPLYAGMVASSVQSFEERAQAQ